MQKKGLFKKLGAVMMAVAMTAMMVPGVVFADDPSQDPGQNPGQAPANTTITSIELEVAAPEAGKAIPTLPILEEIEKGYCAEMKGSVGTGENIIQLGWVQNKASATGTFVDGQEYTCMVGLNALYGYEFAQNLTVKIGEKNANLVKKVTQGEGQFVTEYWVYGANWTIGGGEASSNKITDGDGNETIKATTGKALVLRCSHKLDGFQTVLCDGTEVPENMREVKEGSTVVTLIDEFVDSLAEGDHKITFRYDDGDIETTITLTKAAAEPESPKTAQTTDMTVVVFMVSVLGLAGLGFYGKKRNIF